MFLLNKTENTQINQTLIFGIIKPHLYAYRKHVT